MKELEEAIVTHTIRRRFRAGQDREPVYYLFIHLIDK